MTCSIEWGFHVTKCHHVLLKIQNMSPCWVSHHFRCWETLTSWRWDNRDPKATRSGQWEHIVSLLWEAWEKNGNIGTPMGRVKKLKCHGFPRGFHRILFGYGFCQLLFGYGSTGSTVYSMVTKYCFNLIFLLLSFFVCILGLFVHKDNPNYRRFFVARKWCQWKSPLGWKYMLVQKIPYFFGGY